MPEICRFYGIIITIYFMDHAPPHFHVRYNEYKASVSIETMVVTHGVLPRRVLAMVREWAAAHQDELRTNWQRAMTRGRLVKIQPLD
jgi:hypothetical protein